MKKTMILAAAVCALLTSSCGVIKMNNATATKVPVGTMVTSVNVADLEVGKRVTYRYTTTAADRRAGAEVCKNAAIQALLKANGDADVIVSPEFSYDSDINYVEVTGRPAFYKNFRSAN